MVSSIRANILCCVHPKINPNTNCDTFPSKKLVSGACAPCFACAWDICMGGAWVAQRSCRDMHSSDYGCERAYLLAGIYINLPNL